MNAASLRREIACVLLASFSATLALADGSAGAQSQPQAPAKSGRERDASTAGPDAPYVWLAKDGGWLVKRIVAGEDGPKVVVEEKKRGDDALAVDLGGTPFSVHLRADEPVPACEHAEPETLLVLSDIEGNLPALVALLRAAGAVDAKLDWTFGTGHVVLVGDFVDRGTNVTECLWLVYELEARARNAGGGVHYVLGNHEVMNLTGDLRYVRRKYTENAALLGTNVDALWTRETVLGRLMRTRNVIERLGDVLFVHGGISPAVAAKKPTLTELTTALRTALLADTWTKPKDGLLAMAAGNEGLTWYRGYVQAPTASESDLDTILAAFGAKRIVVGHTIVKEIGLTLGGRVLTVDVHHAEGTIQAALMQKGRWSRLLADGSRQAL